MMLIKILPLMISSGLMGVSLLAFFLSYWFSATNSCLLLNWELLNGGFQVNVPIFLDPISLSFLGSVALISGSVLIFSYSYMTNDKYFIRFHLLVLSFVASMLLLILSPNMISLLLGWDGLGITSYLLVIYFGSSKSFNAGMITALSNRVGDCLILISIAMWVSEASWDFFLMSSGEHSTTPFVALALLTLAATTKSAQIPFSAWLPAAMAAPTPVSSLVHSSTLVTAGVYLMVRFDKLLEQVGAHIYLLLVGCCTMMLAGVAALSETDMKKIVALSTLSQLGLMMSSLGMGAPLMAFFHLLTHAYFKALLFMTVGNMIHLSSDFQDLRAIGIHELSISPTLSFSLIANLSLMGLPFLAGFYSKDSILETTLASNMNIFILSLFFFATLLTAAYTLRLLSLMAWGWKSLPPMTWINDNDSAMTYSMLFLWPLAICGGSFLLWGVMPPSGSPILPSLCKSLVPLVILTGSAWGLFWQLLMFKETSSIKTWGWGMMWALPFNSSRLLSLTGFTSGLLARSLVDLKWSPMKLSSPLLSTKSAELESLPSFWFSKAVIFTLVSLVWIILIYLCIFKKS